VRLPIQLEAAHLRQRALAQTSEPLLNLVGLVAFVFWTAAVSILIWKRGRAHLQAQPGDAPSTG